MKGVLILFGVLGLLSQDLFAAEVPKGAQETIDTLSKASIFVIGPFGFAGTISAAEKALRQVVQQKDAREVLTKLLSEATPEGQMYALVGLKTVDKAEFQSRLKSYRDKFVQVRTAAGCIVSDQAASEVAKAIAAGRYDLTPAGSIQPGR